MRRVLLTSFAALVLSAAAERAAFACVCVVPREPPPPEQARAALAKDFNKALAVFTGEVVELDTFKVKFKVDKIWKGSFGDEIVMRTGTIDGGDGTYSTSSCDYSFGRGGRYLVFAYGDSAAGMQAHACTRTKELKHAEREIGDLDEVWPHERRNRKPEERN